MLDSCEQLPDRMASGGVTKVICRDVQIDLCASDLPMTEQVTNRHEADAGAHEVGGEGVSQSMRRERHAEVTALAPGAHAFVNGAA